MVSAERELIREYGVGSTAGSRGRAPGQQVRVKAPLKLKTFELSDENRKWQIR